MELTNYKYTKSLFPNTLRCNHLSTKKKFFFFNTKLTIYLFLKVIAFTIVLLKNLGFRTLKSYLIYFYYLTLQYIQLQMFYFFLQFHLK